MSTCLITAAICAVFGTLACKSAYVRGQNSTLAIVLKRLSHLADEPWDGVERRVLTSEGK